MQIFVYASKLMIQPVIRFKKNRDEQNKEVGSWLKTCSSLSDVFVRDPFVLFLASIILAVVEFAILLLHYDLQRIIHRKKHFH